MYSRLKLNLRGSDFSGGNINPRQMKRHETHGLKIIPCRDIESRNIVLLYIETRAGAFVLNLMSCHKRVAKQIKFLAYIRATDMRVIIDIGYFFLL